MYRLKLYGDFTKADWLSILKIKEEEIPQSFILHGEWEHEWNISYWKKILQEEQWIPSWNAIIGEYNKQRIGFANVFGGPIAASIAHRFAVLGTNRFIQTGYFGGLSHEIRYGDIFIVTAAVMEDGVSHWYLPNEKTVYADEMLVEKAVKYCEEKNYKYITGTVFSTGAIMAETGGLAKEWANQGYIGVDMETATTFAVAKRFNKKAVSLLNLSDHISKGDTLYSNNEDRGILEERTDERIREIALHLSELK
ncbi:uridine phosphorylase [Lederbergia sp. NSJ-179]|uniref:nucleoside phosphorylase n=1 Tax=Lederbergia sp. NSJ-179 TaxID=2931402 RepID=UPI001FD00F14|nr:uridine phosphorylase [Lederbergia sp. NSJ-179]MCJ7842403.1 uridine phosphorylase [Lederbergia sp. NSJ-179]